MDKFSELIKLDLKILKDKMAVLRKESLNLRFQKSSGQLEKTARISVVKKQIARIKTAMNVNKKMKGKK
jgi:large subunit ribosomal protein L29